LALILILFFVVLFQGKEIKALQKDVVRKRKKRCEPISPLRWSFFTEPSNQFACPVREDEWGTFSRNSLKRKPAPFGKLRVNCYLTI